MTATMVLKIKNPEKFTPDHLDLIMQAKELGIANAETLNLRLLVETLQVLEEEGAPASILTN